VNQPRLKAVMPLPDHEYYWRKLMNHLFGCGEDELFCWLQDVRRVVEEAERERREGRAA
jgi:hypothetical protein